MGDRAQVEFITESKKIYFYTHYDGSDLENIVSNALKRGVERHSDPEYLASIIFCEMVQKDILMTTGHGIGLNRYEKVVIVNCDNQEVTFFNGNIKPFKDFILKEQSNV